MRYSVYIFLLLFLLYGCSSSSVREQYGLKLKEFPIDCDSLIKSIEIDRLGDAEFSSEVTQVDENIVKVHIRFDLKDTVKQDDWQVQIKPAFKPEFNWAPHLTPTVNNIIDQHVFRSPALIATDQQRGIVIIPDLDILSRSGKNRWYMVMVRRIISFRWVCLQARYLTMYYMNVSLEQFMRVVLWNMDFI